MRINKASYVLAFLILLGAQPVWACATLTIRWAPNTEPDLSGYLVRCTHDGKAVMHRLPKEDRISTFTNLKPGHWSCTVAALNQTGQESPPSISVQKEVSP